MIVAAIQTNSTNNIDHNLNECQDLIKEAAKKKARLICLPENFAFFGSKKDKIQMGKTIEIKVLDFLKTISQETKAFVLAGGYPVLSNDGSPETKKFFNRATMVNPQGNIIWQYDKIHLFDVEAVEKFVYRESDSYRHGTAIPKPIQMQNFSVNAAICYDIRFPEMFREMSKSGMDLLMITAAFTKKTGIAHWYPLLQARAIENQCYVLAAAQVGTHFDGRETFGNSVLISPWGEILQALENKVGVCAAEISKENIEKLRKSFPVLKHRRL